MKKTFVILLTIFFANTYVISGYSSTDDCSYKKYCGNMTSFNDFNKEYKKEWPVPKVIDYYDPNGKDKVIRYAYWEPESESKAGIVVHFNGRTEFIEKNIYTYNDLLKRGFEVWAFDWRGQGLSQRKEIKEKQKHNIDTFDTYLNDVEHFINNIVKIKNKKGKKVLLAHSMGGQIALRYLIDHPSTFDYAILSSPLLRVPGDNEFLRFFNPIKRFFGRGDVCIGTDLTLFNSKIDILGLYHSPEWSGNFQENKACNLTASNYIETSNLKDLEETKRYSNDFNKLADIDCLIESSIDANGEDKPDLRLACPTSNWLAAAFESTDNVLDHAVKLKTPTLIVRTLPDSAVDNAAQDAFCEQAEKNCKIIDIKKVGHEILIETEATRKEFFKNFDKHITH